MSAEPQVVYALREIDPETVSAHQYMQALYAYAHYLHDRGVPADQIMDPALFFDMVEDLPSFLHVVNNWPISLENKPSLYKLLLGLRLNGAGATTNFQREMSFYISKKEVYAASKPKRGRPSDLTPEERMERLAQQNRDRVARHRNKQALPETDDPGLWPLYAVHEAAVQNLATGKAWAKRAKADAIAERDAAIAASKAHCSKTVSEVDWHIRVAEDGVTKARRDIDNYKAAKQ